MNVKVHNYVRIMTKLALYAFVICQSLLLCFASDVDAQRQYLNEIEIELSSYENADLKDLINDIQEKSQFEFASPRKLISKKTISLNEGRWNMENLLKEISSQAEVSIRRVNETISFSEVEMQALPDVVEVNILQVSVAGTITDENGEGLPGATIQEKGTTNGTITDVEGVYSLSVPEDATLIISFVGYQTREVQLNGRSVLDLSLEADVSALEEVVVVGYGSQKKSDLTGAVTSLDGEDLAVRRTTQVSQALQGSVPGVMVTRSNNAPGSSASIRIRGITTIGDSNPLIIVDGVPMNSIDDINPNDIENISVLKDAASASIYGARAASGVIVVTTKRARKGQLSLDYNYEYGFETPTQIPEYVDITRYMQMTNELRWNDNGNDANEYPAFAEDMVRDYLSLNASDPDLYPNTDWVDLVLNKTAPKEHHAIGISGGNEFISSKASFVYDKVNALYDNSSFERITTRINTDATINKMLDASVDFYFTRETRESTSRDPIYFMWISAPIYPAVWADGRVAGGKTGANIYGQLKYGGFVNNWGNQLGGRAALNFKPVEGLKVSAVISPQLGFDKGKNFQKRVPYYAADDPTVFEGTLQWASSTDLSESRNDSYRMTTQFLINYDKEFAGHTIGALAGYENFTSFYESLSASRDQYLLDNFPYLNIGPLEFRDNSGSAVENAYRSWFGRISYNYRGKYFVQGNVRFDASSRFHPDYRWGSFPSFSAGWVISEETFIPDNSILSFLKLRGSWGRLGNERIGNYPYQSTIGFSNALLYQGSNVVSAQSAAQWQYAIQDISWETTESYNIGIDANFFDYRLNFTADYFEKTTKDMLLPLEIPDYIGFDNPDQNTGKMFTKGWELDLGWTDDINEFGYSVSFNLSDFRSEMGDLGGIQFLGNQIKIEGSEFNEWYGYKSDGLFQTQEEVDNSPVTSGSVRPGDVKYVDISGPDGVPDGVISPEYDRTLLGGSLPRYMYGGNVKLDYKNFDFTLVIQGVGKQNDRLEGLMITPLMENWGHIPKIIDGDYWSNYNTPQQNMSAYYPRLTRTGGSNNYTMSDYWMFNGAYLRVKNVTLGYSIPKNILDKIGIQNIRLYSSVSDLLTLNNYPTGWDPEVSSSGYPITMSVIFGASVKF